MLTKSNCRLVMVMPSPCSLHHSSVCHYFSVWISQSTTDDCTVFLSCRIGCEFSEPRIGILYCVFCVSALPRRSSLAAGPSAWARRVPSAGRIVNILNIQIYLLIATTANAMPRSELRNFLFWAYKGFRQLWRKTFLFFLKIHL